MSKAKGSFRVSGIAATIGLIALSAIHANAQGCIVGRQCSPGEIGSGNYLMPNEAEISLSYREFRATDHYNGTVRQTQRQALGNFVINQQNIWDAIGSLGLNKQSQITLDIPFINSGWSVPLPVGSATTPHGPRAQQRSIGIGDIEIVYKRWILDTATHRDGNFAFGAGLKLPTGNDDVKNNYPNLTGGDISPKSVDQSIQPGDGGWGFPTSLEAFKMYKAVDFFLTGSYLINPRDTNGVPSILADLGAKAPASAPSLGVNSVPDQYLIRFGAGGAIPFVRGLSGALAWRKEGVPVKDLIGGSHGWRRPGFSTSIEPSLAYSASGYSYSLAVPITLTRDR
jgi:hypothetical protein